MSTFADTIRDARTRAMMSQGHLAEAAGVSERTVKRAEAGESLSSETLLALSAVLDIGTPEAPARPSATAYAALIPPAERVEVTAPTGLLTLGHDPAREGRIHGIMTGLAFPGTCRTAHGFLGEYGPDNGLTSEHETLMWMRDRLFWIDVAARKATDADDIARIGEARVEARRAVVDAEEADKAAVRRHHAWASEFSVNSGTWRIASRAIQVLSCAVAASLMPSFPAAVLMALTLFAATAFMASYELCLRFDKGEAWQRRRSLIDARGTRNERRIVELHASGLTP